MLRAAAKNHESVAVVVDPADYARVLAELEANAGGTSARHALAPRRQGLRAHGALRHHGGELPARRASGSPRSASRRRCRWCSRRCRTCATARTRTSRPRSTASPRPAARASPPRACCRARSSRSTTSPTRTRRIECVRQFDEPACVIVKHANPCGVAVAASPLEAYDGAYRTDPTSAFGGIIAFNRELDAATAAAIIERQFVEVLAAPVDLRRTRRRCSRRSRTCACWRSATCTQRRRREARISQRDRRPARADARPRHA